jgi:hypothetical protein
MNVGLFMDNPVQTRDTTHSFKSHILPREDRQLLEKDDKLYYKGGKHHHKNKSSYKHLGGEEDVYLIDNGVETFQLHRATLLERLHEFSNLGHLSIHHLNEDHTEAFADIAGAITKLYGTEALYDLIHDDIKHAFHIKDHHDLIPGTVAAYFVGCMDDSNFPGGVGCDPKCAGSIPADINQKPCDDLVLLYSDHTFTSLNDVTSNHAYIYIEGNTFDGFTRDSIQQLHDEGVTSVTLIFGNPNGSYREISEDIPVEQLQVNNTQNTETTSNTTAVCILFLLIIIVILVLLYVFYRTHYRTGTVIASN